MSDNVERITALNLAIAHIGPMSYTVASGSTEVADGTLTVEEQVGMLVLIVAKEFEKYIVGDGSVENTRPLETNDGPSKIETRVHADQMQLEDQECARCGVTLKDHLKIEQEHLFEPRKS